MRGGNGTGKSSCWRRSRLRSRSAPSTGRRRTGSRFSSPAARSSKSRTRASTPSAGRGRRARTPMDKKLGFSTGERQLKSLQEIVNSPTPRSICSTNGTPTSIRRTRGGQRAGRKAGHSRTRDRDLPPRRGVGCVGCAAPYSPTNSTRRSAAGRPRADPPCRRRAAVRRPALIGQNGVIRVAAPPSPEGLPHDRSLCTYQSECSEDFHRARGTRTSL